jgi:hypothetical protein
MDSVTRFFASGFFHESPSPKPLIMTLESFRIISKFRGDIRKSRCTTGVNDTGGKFATGVNNTGGKLPPVSRHRRQICHRYQRHRRKIFPPVPLVLLANLPPVSTIPAANLPPVSLTTVANNWNNIRLQTPERELEGKNLYICFLYYPKVTK